MARAALVTGGARGIGRAIVAALAPDHALAFTHRDTDAGAVLADHPEAVAIRADLADPDTPVVVIAEAVARLGRLDTLVLNAGMIASGPPDAPDLATQRAMFEVNLFAPQALLAAALPQLEPGAAVVAVSSINAQLPPRGSAGYGASKAALDLWVRGMAKELGPRGIRVNAVAPGAIEREESPRPPDLVELFVNETALGRIGRPEDVARVVRFLASDAAGFVTGEVLTVSGGYRL